MPELTPLTVVGFPKLVTEAIWVLSLVQEDMLPFTPKAVRVPVPPTARFREEGVMDRALQVFGFTYT